MAHGNKQAKDDITLEDQEWRDSLAEVLHRAGPERAEQLLEMLQDFAHQRGVRLPKSSNTPYANTIAPEDEPAYPGSREIERRIKSLCRWNAMAMVVRANRELDGIGGHISTYASAATLWEVAFNHFLRAPDPESGFSGDQVFFQGHGSPGIYARAFLEGRLDAVHLDNFRRELQKQGGLSSYPHPWLMPDFWSHPTVSMGLSPLMAIYQARFNRYMEHRGIKDTSDSRIWCFMGDGETDEPESLGAITLASRENLDNLTFVINCNLQRLDGPVRGNGKIVQELEAAFRGAGWNVIKVIWGSDWDPLFKADSSGVLLDRLDALVDGEEQKLSTESGEYVRENLFGKNDRLRKLVDEYSDDQLVKLRRGGHDPQKVYAAYHAAVNHTGQPTVILAKTIKGYGLGEAGEGRNVTHQQKKLNEDELKEFRSRFGVPISDEDVEEAPFYRPAEDSTERTYLVKRRDELGGPFPRRSVWAEQLEMPQSSLFEEFHEGSDDRQVATTMAYVRMLTKLMKDENIGKYIVPIIPDEARTFGMDSMFRQFGIYSSVGQKYEPVDANNILYYRESTDGQLIEEGITEAGSISSFIAAGTAHASHGQYMIPFFSFYSMFGFQRVGDFIWAAGDCRARGFLVGGTAGRTTLNGEGLQHEDGHSHLLAAAVPNLKAYDPGYAYEVAVIIEEGLRRMYVEEEDIFYYLTVYNETYEQPAIPGDVRDEILKGLYRVSYSRNKSKRPRANILASGPLLPVAEKAVQRLESDFDIATDLWSVTSYKELHTDAQSCTRWNRLHPDSKKKKPFVTSQLERNPGVSVAVSDYVTNLPDSISRWVPGTFQTLGTDGYGRSDSREDLRDFFEIDDRHITLAVLQALLETGDVTSTVMKKAVKEFDIDPEKAPPVTQ